MKTTIKTALRKVFIEGEVINKEGGICFMLIGLPAIVLMLIFSRHLK